MDILEQGNAPRITHVKIGDQITVNEENEDGRRNYVTYTIISVHPFCVVGRKKNGSKRSFSYGDLVIAGMEYQGCDVEELKNEKVRKPFRKRG